jgi:hypothetical protein
MPSWWMPDSCWKALAPTMALWGWTAMPVYSFTILEVGVMWTGSIPVRRSGPLPVGPFSPKCVGPFNARAITTSSNAALPARSPARSISLESRPNSLKINKETTHDVLSWRRVASMA